VVALGAVHPLWSRCTCVVLMGYRRISRATNPDHKNTRNLPVKLARPRSQCLNTIPHHIARAVCNATQMHRLMCRAGWSRCCGQAGAAGVPRSSSDEDALNADES
jgi:hypothetical protein